MNKLFIVSLLIIVILLISFFIWQYNFSDKDCKVQKRCEINVKLKEVKIHTYTDKIVQFNVPAEWNTFLNGDPELITDIDNYFNKRSLVYSVSVSDRPITYTDINWEQIDFYLTDGDLINEQFVNNNELKDGLVLEEIDLDDFSGYLITDLLESEVPNKFDTGGETLFLRPKLDDVTWNLIINKQALGSAKFEDEFDELINSITINNF